jgi:sulfur carrier protein
MRVLVNGSKRDLPDTLTVELLLSEMGIDQPRGVAVAVDGEVISRGHWDQTTIRDGQRIEILRAVQGG